MKRKLFWLLILSFCANILMQAQQEPSVLFQKANESFVQNDYKKAIESYQEVESLGFESSNLYFNRARSHYELNERVMALIYLERCLKISPSHEEALSAKKAIINQLENPIVNYIEVGFKQKWISWFNFLSANIWSYLFVLSLLVLLIINFVSLKSLIKIPFFVKILTAILCTVLFVNACSISNAETAHDFGLVNTNSAKIYSTADLESTVKNEVTEAQKLKILDNIAEWYKIQLPNRETGWILKDQLIVI